MLEKTQITVNIITSVVLIISTLINGILMHQSKLDRKNKENARKQEIIRENKNYIFDSVLREFLFVRLPHIEKEFVPTTEDDVIYELLHNLEVYYEQDDVKKLKNKIYELEDLLINEASYRKASDRILALKKEIQYEILKLKEPTF